MKRTKAPSRGAPVVGVRPRAVASHATAGPVGKRKSAKTTRAREPAAVVRTGPIASPSSAAPVERKAAKRQSADAPAVFRKAAQPSGARTGPSVRRKSAAEKNTTKPKTTKSVLRKRAQAPVARRDRYGNSI